MTKAHQEATIRPDLSEFGEPRSARSILADKRGLSTSIPESLGALGLGIVVLGTLAVGIGAAFNYGQDSGAQSTLDAVKSAQVLFQARNASYGDVPGLTTGQDPALPKSNPHLAIAKNATDYCAAMKSDSMFPNSYWVTARTGTVTNTKPALAQSGVACPDPL
ncbi:hypothetical protein WMO79_01180 [Micrococcaceae bacterium Sec7.4]